MRIKSDWVTRPGFALYRLIEMAWVIRIFARPLSEQCMGDPGYGTQLALFRIDGFTWLRQGACCEVFSETRVHTDAERYAGFRNTGR